MKKNKNLLTILLTIMMLIVMGMNVFAGSAVTSSSDRLKVVVRNIDNVESGEIDVKVTAYRIVSADYTANGFTGYSWEKGCGFADDKEVFDIDTQLNLSDVEVAGLANKINELPSFEMVRVSDSTVFESVEALGAGTYMILVSGSNQIIYNPMLVSVYYTIDGTGIATDPVDAGSSWALKTDNAYAKSSKPSIEKVILKADGSVAKGDGTSYTEDINFRITGTIPSYSAQYDVVEYSIIDTISEGISFVSSADEVTVKVAGAIVDQSSSTYSIDISGKTMKISFTSDYIKMNGTKSVEVTYKAELNLDAKLNFDSNTNTVYAEYTNSPDSDSIGRTSDSRTYHYTFAIDASLNGVTENITKELYKTNEGIMDTESGNIEYEYLNGAEFTLTRMNVPEGYTGKTEFIAVTGDGGVDGDIQFTGLDEGTYKLVETKAPEGYQIDTTEHEVKIEAEYNDNGTLASYTITIDNVEASRCVYQNHGGVKITEIDRSKEGVTLIKNTKLAELPATGGMGTTVFTIVGCIIMILAAVLFFVNRRKSDDD